MGDCPQNICKLGAWHLETVAARAGWLWPVLMVKSYFFTQTGIITDRVLKIPVPSFAGLGLRQRRRGGPGNIVGHGGRTGR